MRGSAERCTVANLSISHDFELRGTMTPQSARGLFSLRTTFRLEKIYGRVDIFADSSNLSVDFRYCSTVARITELRGYGMLL